MRAKGKDKCKQFAGGVDRQRKKLNTLTDDHSDLVEDVRDLERAKRRGDGTKQIIVVDIGDESEEVHFRFFDAVGTDAGPVPAGAQ